jgi:hypothetical protein
MFHKNLTNDSKHRLTHERSFRPLSKVALTMNQTKPKLKTAGYTAMYVNRTEFGRTDMTILFGQFSISPPPKKNALKIISASD